MYFRSNKIILVSILLYLLSGLLFGMHKENKIQKTKILLIAESKNIEYLIKLFKSMEKDRYFQNIQLNLEISLPSSYPEAQKDKVEIKFLGDAITRAFLSGTLRILFSDTFFTKDEDIQKGFLLHELAHHIIYDSSINRELYNKWKSVGGLTINSTNKEMKRIMEDKVNPQIVYILRLPDEVLAEKWLYKNFPDLFRKRVSAYLVADRENISKTESNIALNIAGNLDLQTVINRILLLKSMYSFYDGDSKSEHLALVKKLEVCIKQLSDKYKFNSDFIFVYIDKIIYECTKEKIAPEILIELFLSYRKDFFEKVFKVPIE